MVLRSRPATGRPKDYTAEFKELGVAAVRKELHQKRWRPEKLAAARLWVESQDNQSWLAKRRDTPPVDKRKKRPMWVVYAIGAALFAFGAARLLQKLF